MCLGGGSAPSTPPPAPPPSAPAVVQTGASMGEAKRRRNSGTKGTSLRSGDREYNPYKREKRKVHSDGKSSVHKYGDPTSSKASSSTKSSGGGAARRGGTV